jgi:hypothetical protein
MILARFNKCEVPNFFKRLDIQIEDLNNTHCFLRLIVALIKEIRMESKHLVWLNKRLRLIYGSAIATTASLMKT